MTKTITINKENFKVDEKDFNTIPHSEFNNLNILDSLGQLERLISFLKEVSLLLNKDQKNILFVEISHGGFFPIKISNSYDNISILNKNERDYINIIENIEDKSIKNIKFIDFIHDDSILPPIIFINNNNFNLPIKKFKNSLVIVKETSTEKIDEDDEDFDDLKNFTSYDLSDSNYVIYVNHSFIKTFISKFHYFLTNDMRKFEYDNLIHLSMIVKNAGDVFEDVLTQNLPYFDSWTILDTGSTDNTIEIINKVLVGKKKGQLFQEPFINFRDSRNRCLDLCGKESKFILILDDTYILKENLRTFLNTVRGDQFSDSFSMYIKSDDTEYGSNRIIKSESGVRYIYKLHEVLNPKNNINVIIPIHHAHIFDVRSEYMEKRTMDRKEYDLKILYEMVDEEPEDSRALYYLAQTYNLLNKPELALEFFIKRTEHSDEGFLQEKIDAYFEAARICNFKLDKPWEECESLYMKAYDLDKSRPESLYFIGIHHYMNKDFLKAYEYMKKGFEIGYPIHCQYSLKPTLSFYFLPKFLSEICFLIGDNKLGLDASHLFLTSNKDDNSVDYYTVKCWNKIFLKLLNVTEYPNIVPLSATKPIFTFVADGGFEPWNGSDILSNGVGGSETFIIEMSRYIQQSNLFDVYVFCNCKNEEVFENVTYLSLDKYSSFLKHNKIHTSIISRYPEYLPVTYNSNNVENVYLILHDLIPNGEIIIKNERLRNIFCLSQWHADQFNLMFDDMKHLTKVFNYGIDITSFENKDGVNSKIPYKFIYSSFAHRGLLPLLQMWPSIIQKYPSASLHIHCDLDNKWVNSVRKDEIQEIRNLILINKEHNVFYKGWTSKKELAKTWYSADIWFYPCTFLETFCLTAVEAAISKTLVITNDLAALNETVGDRGIIIKGDPYTSEWKDEALEKLFSCDLETKKQLIETNYSWAKNKDWKNRANDLLKLVLNQEDDIVFLEERIKQVETVKKSLNSDKEEQVIFSVEIDKQILNYYIFKGNKKTSKILEINNHKLNQKKNILTQLMTTNFSLTSICDNEIVMVQEEFSGIEFIKKDNNVVLENVLLNNDCFYGGKYDFILLNQMNENNLVLFSILNVCFNNALRNSGILGVNVFDGLEIFIERNIDRFNVLKKDGEYLFIEKRK